MRVGRDEDNNATLEDRLNETPFGVPTPLKHGVYKVKVEDVQADGGRVYGVVTDPLPAYVRSLLVALDFESSN